MIVRKKEIAKFQPAIEIFRNDQGISSHLITFVVRIFWRNSSGVNSLMFISPEQLLGPGQNFASIPAWYPARHVPTKIAPKADKAPTNLNFGLNKIRVPIIIAKTWGSRCQTHNLQGARPNIYWKYRAAMSAEAEHITSERMTLFNRLKVIILNTNMLLWELLLWLQK